MGSVSTPGFPAWPDNADHKVLAFVSPQTRIDFAALTELMRERARANGARFATDSSSGVIDQVAVFDDKWIVLVTFQENDAVFADLRDMAGHYYGEHPRTSEMATCRCRVDIHVLDPAVHVAAFDCLDTAREWLKSQPGVIAIDPESGEDV